MEAGTIGGGEPATTSQHRDTDNTAPQQQENKFQQAIAAWRNIDLTNLMSTLDGAASDLVEHQRDGLVQRKELAQKTKDFRKLDDSNKLVEFKGLLKAYQSYIDLITNQSKAIHSAFLKVYSPLSEAPDPYPLLEASIDSMVTSEETVPKLNEENQQLRQSVSKLTSQLEDTESRLEEERATRQEVETSRDEKIKSAEASWSAVLSEKQDNWDAKEKTLEEKIEHQDRLVQEIKASYEVSQRLNKSEGESEAHRSGVTAAELEIVNSELDRANTRLADVEARNEQLRLQLAQSASNLEGTRSGHVEDDPAFLRLQSENSSLLRKLDNFRLEKDSDRRKWEGDMKNLERDVDKLKRDRDVLRQKLHEWGDYDNVKRELEVLKSIEFATGDDDAEAYMPASTDSKGESLEQLLLARNKKLSNELTLLRVSHQDLQSKLEPLQEELSRANMELEQSRALVTALESDLEKIQQEAANHFPSSMSVAGTSRYPHSSFRGASRSGHGGRSSSPTSSIISGFDPGYTDPREASAGASSTPSILPMVQSQRDRFKRKNAELENELQKNYATIQSLRSEIASLQKDNLSLYEKSRYMTSYARSQPPSAPSTTSTSYPSYTPSSPPPPHSAASPIDTRYRSAYESRLTSATSFPANPFAAFRGRESARALRQMSAPERAVWHAARAVLGSRSARNLFAMYCLGLHLLVIVLLYSSVGSSAGTVRKVAGPLAEGAAAAAAAGMGEGVNADGEGA